MVTIVSKSGQDKWALFSLVDFGLRRSSGEVFDIPELAEDSEDWSEDWLEVDSHMDIE